MRHRKANRQLRRTSEQRLALLRNLATSLIESGAIETTEAKAKELRPFIEKLITKAKTGTLHNRRLAGRHVAHRATADKLFKEIGPQFASRKGGYTRILKTGHRKGDGAEMATALAQSLRCTDTPRPRVTKPMISSPGTGVQQRERRTITSSSPST